MALGRFATSLTMYRVAVVQVVNWDTSHDLSVATLVAFEQKKHHRYFYPLIVKSRKITARSLNSHLVSAIFQSQSSLLPFMQVGSANFQDSLK